MVQKENADMKKYSRLLEIVRSMESVVIAYSGGVDSTFLVKAAHEALGANGKGDKLLAVTARSSTYPESEFNQAVEQVKEIGAPHRVIDSEELDIPGFADNPPDRCFHCKGELFGILDGIAKKEGYKFVCDGSNLDDTNDYRPGRDAAKKLGVRSPLIEAEMTKDDIRRHSKRLGLPTWDKPAAACLASRFPYGEKITADKLNRVEKAEEILKEAGFKQVRVRHHEGIARIELNKAQIGEFISHPAHDAIVKKIKELGFTYVTLDLEGYRTGSLNDLL